MTRIRELMERDLSRRIAEVIQVDQADEQAVYDELTATGQPTVVP